METTVPGKSVGVLAAAGHIKLSDELRTKIAASRQAPLDKKDFRQSEESIAENTDKTNDPLTHNHSSGHIGTALPVGKAVHAALGRKVIKPDKKKQRCHFGHTTTSSKVWLRNPLPSFWAGVPSEVLHNKVTEEPYHRKW